MIQMDYADAIVHPCSLLHGRHLPVACLETDNLARFPRNRLEA